MNLIRDFQKSMDKEWLYEKLLHLFKLERRQTFPAYEAAARYVYKLAAEAGFDTELMEFPADGKTVFQDKTCPLG